MAENNFIPPVQRRCAEPELRRTKIDPKGVLQKNLKIFVYLGAALLVIAAALFSSTSKKTPAQQAAAKGQPPQPTLQDNTDNNVQDLKNQLKAERDKESSNSRQPRLLRMRRSCARVCDARATGRRRSLWADWRCRALCSERPIRRPARNRATVRRVMVSQATHSLNSRRNSNRHSSSPQRSASEPTSHASLRILCTPVPRNSHNKRRDRSPAAQYAPASPSGRKISSLQSPRAAGEPQEAAGGYKRPVEADIDSARGQPYLVYEGSVLDTVLMNRLDGDAAGPVKVLVSNPLYSHDHQHVIIPEGTVVLGEAKKIGSAGFGQQRRMAVVFHRLIMPDGYSVDLDQFHGLDQIGEEGLKDKVNNHYFEIFGASIALGVIAGAGEITQGGGTISTSGSQAFTTGTAGSISQSANTILDRFMQIPPTITIREGHRVKIYFTQDMLLPAYSNHTIPQTF